jgi:hypothetical protein
VKLVRFIFKILGGLSSESRDKERHQMSHSSSSLFNTDARIPIDLIRFTIICRKKSFHVFGISVTVSLFSAKSFLTQDMTVQNEAATPYVYIPSDSETVQLKDYEHKLGRR